MNIIINIANNVYKFKYLHDIILLEVNMDISVLNNKIVIVKDSMKNSLLKYINNFSKLLNIKIITLSELKKNLYFDYKNEAIYYLCNKYNVVSNIARIYLENLYYINDFNDDKILFLNKVKKELDDNGLLIYNKLFSSYLNGKDIVLFDLDYVDKFYLNILSMLGEKNNVSNLSINKDYGKKDLYECKNSEEEISFVASEICRLVKNGISINNIKLANVSSSYYFTIKKIFKLFNIPINLDSNSSIKGTKIVKCFKDNFSSNINSTLEKVYDLVKNKNDEEIYKKIVNVINSYTFTDLMNVKELIFEDIDKIKTSSRKYKNAIEVIDICNSIVSDEEYVFLINYNEGVIPVNNKDIDYLSDIIKDNIGISTSFDLNSKGILNVVSAIKRIKNLTVTYSKYDGLSELYISPSYDEKMFNIKNVSINYNNSNLYNTIVLTSLMDENNKYGVVSDDLISLKNHYSNFKYLDYSNKYTPIPKNDLYDFIGRKLSLSYSSISNYYECAFKYYLNYVLKINKYKDSFEIIIGNIFHHILSKCFNDGFDFEFNWKSEVDNLDYVFSESEKYFLSLLKEKLAKVIEIIKNQLNYTQLDKTMYEKEVIVKIDDDMNVTFKGFVDKILYGEFGGNIIAVIIDYKTGNPVLNINNSVYGIDMQLPVYVYLIKNTISNVRIGGFYLQKILNKTKNDEEEKSMLKLQGYSNSDYDVLEKVDSSYIDSELIKSMKVGENGFYHYSKIISDEEIDILYNIVSDKIKAASKDILDAKFNINPKKIGDDVKGCKYCKYKDICYMKNEDIVELETVTNIFGGDE